MDAVLQVRAFSLPPGLLVGPVVLLVRQLRLTLLCPGHGLAKLALELHLDAVRSADAVREVLLPVGDVLAFWNGWRGGWGRRLLLRLDVLVEEFSLGCQLGAFLLQVVEKLLREVK